MRGGATTFYTPLERELGALEARGVAPARGCVLCFPHGETAPRALVHEGAQLSAGVKYIVRTDVLYEVEPEAATEAGRPAV